MAFFVPSATAAIPAPFTISRKRVWCLIVGSNTAESHPVLATRVKRAHKLHGQKLIVADLREHEMARRADVFLHPQPGRTSSGSLQSLGICSTTALHTTTSCANGERTRRVQEALAPFTMEFASQTCGLPVETLKRVAHMIAEPTACACFGRWE